MRNNFSSFKVDLTAGAFCMGFYFWMALTSNGFIEPDEMSHFMKSADALTHWPYVLDIWGRPFCIAYYALGVKWGITAARFLSIIASVLTAIGTIRLAQNFLPLVNYPFRSYRALLWLLLFAQPYFMLQSFSVMTEILLAFFWVWAAVAVTRDRWLLAGLCIGLSGLTRPEGSIAAAAWPVFVILFRDHFKLPIAKIIISSCIAFLPSILWWIAGIYVFGGSDWFIRHWPWAVESVYGKTPVEAVLAVLNAANFWMIVPFAAGIIFLIKKPFVPFELRKQSVILLLIPVGCVFVLHFLLGVLGLFGSLSLPRYYVTVSPFIAIITWLGMVSLYEHFQKELTRRLTVVIVILLIPSRALYMLDRGDLPFPKSCDQVKLDVMIAWFQVNRHDTGVRFDPAPEKIVAAHPYVSYILTGSSNTPGSHRLFKKNGIKSAPEGTVLIVENGVWLKNGFPPEDSLVKWNYLPVTDEALDQRLADACDNDPLEEDMRFYIKQ